MEDNNTSGSSEPQLHSDKSGNAAATTGRDTALRTWPAILLVLVLWLLRIVPGFLDTSSVPILMAQFMGPLACAGLILLWWVFFSRATLKEKLLGLVGLVLIATVTTAFADKTVQGMGTMLFAIPWGATAFAVALLCLQAIGSPLRTWLALLAALIGFGYWDLVRTDEIHGDFKTVQNWRWQPSAEDRFLQQLADRGSNEQLVQREVAISESEWPGFRGPDRDGKQPGIVIAEDWQSQPPKELWRTAVGPGWSSFSVAGNRIFTQEQRGEDEVIVCYDAGTGDQVWTHQYPSRFWEVIAGAGPRATPTLHQDRLFALGANGILHCLESASGTEIWKRDMSADAERSPPTWGFAASPLITHDVVIVHAGGDGDNGILAYDLETGERRWQASAGNHSYSSCHLADINGKPCVLTLTNTELSIVDPTDGNLLCRHDWKIDNYRVVQPLIFDGNSILLGSPMGTGTRRVDLNFDGETIEASEQWTSRRMNPYYNDFVDHKGFLYGFDNNIFACIDLETGKRKWKRGRYGNGQVFVASR